MAARNRGHFASHRVLALTLVSSPGAGKKGWEGELSPQAIKALALYISERRQAWVGIPTSYTLEPQEARSVSIAGDGTMSADGRPLAQLGLFMPADPLNLVRQRMHRSLTDPNQSNRGIQIGIQ